MNENGFILYYINGRAPLWKVFWLWGVALSWALFGLFYFALSAVGINWVLFFLSGIIMLPYSVWLLVSIWMCAANTSWDFWDRAARFTTIVWALNIGVTAGLMLTELVIGWS